MNHEVSNLEAIASNVRGGIDNSYDATEFLTMYPQFGALPSTVVNAYVNMAKESILESRWFSKHRIALGLYVAHHLTMWAETSSITPLTVSEIAAKGESKGAVMSKSMDGLSVSYGQSAGEGDLSGWGTWKNTLFGQQLVTLARSIGRGGMYVI